MSLVRIGEPQIALWIGSTLRDSLPLHPAMLPNRMKVAFVLDRPSVLGQWPPNPLIVKLPRKTRAFTQSARPKNSSPSVRQSFTIDPFKDSTGPLISGRTQRARDRFEASLVVARDMQGFHFRPVMWISSLMSRSVLRGKDPVFSAMIFAVSGPRSSRHILFECYGSAARTASAARKGGSENARTLHGY